MIAKIIPMVGSEDDHGCFQQIPILQELHQSSQMIVDFRDQSHIGRDHGLTDLIPGKIEAFLMVHERIQNRMRILFFCIIPIGFQNRFRTIKPMVRGWGNVRPVGFDVTQMQAPGLIPELIDPIHGPVGHVCSFRVFLVNPGRKVRMAHLPATEDFSVGSLNGIGSSMPWILAFIPMFPEVPVISHFRIGRLIRMQPIILFPGFKTTFAEQDSPGRFWIDADPLHPLMIRAEMRLACQTDPCPERSEVIPEGPFLQLERDVVVGRTMGRKVTSGIK